MFDSRHYLSDRESAVLYRRRVREQYDRCCSPKMYQTYRIHQINGRIYRMFGEPLLAESMFERARLYRGR